MEALSVSLSQTKSHSRTAESVTVEFGLYSGEHSTDRRYESKDSESEVVSLLPRYEHYKIREQSNFGRGQIDSSLG